jgi:hypothetical protein
VISPRISININEIQYQLQHPFHQIH